MRLDNLFLSPYCAFSRHPLENKTTRGCLTSQVRQSLCVYEKCFGMLCHSPASLLEGGKGGAVSRPHQREAAAMTGGVLGIQPHYDLLFLPRPIGAYPVAAHKRLVRQSLFFHRQVFLKFAAALWLRSRPFTSSQNSTILKIIPARTFPSVFRGSIAGLSRVVRG